MHPLGAYALLLNRESIRNQQPDYAANPDATPDPAPRPGIGARIRRALADRPRIAREPEVAASRGWLDGVLPKLSAYPMASPYR